MQECRTHDCFDCEHLRKIIRFEVACNKKEINTEMSRRLELAEEDRSYVNNTGFMHWYYEKHGYDKRFEFLIHEDILFVVVGDDGKKFIVTCVPARSHLAGRSYHSKPKFNKIKKKKLENAPETKCGQIKRRLKSGCR